MENSGSGIDLLVMSFVGNTYQSGKRFLMMKQETNDETDSLMKVSKNVMLTQMSSKVGINKFGEKAVAAMVKEYRKI